MKFKSLINSEMKKYYCKIGETHYRFDAVNDLAAGEVAKRYAEADGVSVWSAPVIYIPNVHGEHFMRWVA